MTMNQETMETIIEAMENKISELRIELVCNGGSISELKNKLGELTSELTEKCNEVTDLKFKLRQYENKDKVEHAIKMMGRRYKGHTLSNGDLNMSWTELYCSLYKLADKATVARSGRAKKDIISLLRAGELHIDEDGTIFK